MSHNKVLYITQAAIIAAIYVVLTMLFAPISFGTSGIDVRISEALTILPLFTPAAVPGVFVGCLIANIMGGGILVDIIFGSLCTLAGAAFCYYMRKNRWIAPIVTVLANTIVVPFIIRYGYGTNLPIWMLMISVGIGEFLSAYVLGQILATALKPVEQKVFRADAA